jgi:hypothetical protein
VKDFHRAMQPGKLKLPLGRFHQHPDKLGDANICEAYLCNPARVFFPQRFGSLVGVMVNAQQELIR